MAESKRQSGLTQILGMSPRKKLAGLRGRPEDYRSALYHQEERVHAFPPIASTRVSERQLALDNYMKTDAAGDQLRLGLPVPTLPQKNARNSKTILERTSGGTNATSKYTSFGEGLQQDQNEEQKEVNPKVFVYLLLGVLFAGVVGLLLGSNFIDQFQTEAPTNSPTFAPTDSPTTLEQFIDEICEDTQNSFFCLDGPNDDPGHFVECVNGEPSEITTCTGDDGEESRCVCGPFNAVIGRPCDGQNAGTSCA
eukprot:maker-scaffold_4-snap-gene-18.46-mRNA-1 protein AED:0.00 eAED:0.00 QI:164/1/1/1/1/1/3/113/251